MVTNLSPHRLSAVSSIIRKLETENDLKTQPTTDLKFVVANNLFHRLNAFHLGYDEYLKKGYIHENQYGVLMNALDLEEETLTIVAYQGMYEVGTLTVNTQKRLPFQSLFSCDLVNEINFKGAELTRLAINADYKNQKEILLGMFNLAYTYSSFVKKCSHFVIEVNPRHVKFYERYLGFTKVAENESCPRVRGAPAVLLMGDLNLPNIYPENYPFLAQGENRKTLISSLKNIKPTSPREVEILTGMLNQINTFKSQATLQFIES